MLISGRHLYQEVHSPHGNQHDATAKENTKLAKTKMAYLVFLVMNGLQGNTGFGSQYTSIYSGKSTSIMCKCQVKTLILKGLSQP